MLQNRVPQYWLSIIQLNDVPSYKTIWKYWEIFVQAEVLETVFADYVKKLQTINSHIGKDAVMADSSFFEAPKQRNTREENALIKKGERRDSMERSAREKKNAIRILMPTGQRSAKKSITATKAMFWYVPSASSLSRSSPRRQKCTTPRLSTDICIVQKTAKRRLCSLRMPVTQVRKLSINCWLPVCRL